MYRTAFLVAFAALISTAAAAADQPAPAQTAKAQKPEDKIICRFTNTTGSRLIRDRECKTRAEWDRESDDTRDDFEQRAQRPSGDPSPR
jgi:hypothetical protein